MNRIFGRYVLPVAAHGILMPVPDVHGRELVSLEVSGADDPVGCFAGVTGYPVGLVECSVEGVLEALESLGRGGLGAYAGCGNNSPPSSLAYLYQPGPPSDQGPPSRFAPAGQGWTPSPASSRCASRSRCSDGLPRNCSADFARR
jgi:hypothetical protein